MIRAGLILFLGFLFINAKTLTDVHEYYISVTRGAYNSTTGMMQCEMKITAHDLEKSIRIVYSKPFDLDKSNLKKSNEELITKYLTDKIKIKVDGKQIEPELVGFEVEANEDCWIYFQFPFNGKLLEYDNKSLTEQFAMQQNITHFEKGDCKKSFVFTKYTSLEKFDCNE
ncbi:MAG: hypothetical protein H6600_06945 [Flavobacteriales bacterium]|nr:hypothetical protein [Flavobacteriales bacterium]